MADPSTGRDALEELAEEFAARYRRGERPSLTDYAQRYPDLADEILELFPALLVLEEIRPGASSLAVGSGRALAGGAPFERLGEYRIIREIGRGGMGVVYEAEQESLGRRVALKVLPPGALGNSRQVERFRREARAAARLHHTNLVPLFGVGEEGGTHYYVMQYIDGRPLDEVLVELRRLMGEASPRVVPVVFPGAEPGVPDGESRSEGSSSPDGNGNPSSADVALSLWKGQFRAPSRPGVSESGISERPPRPDPAAGADSRRAESTAAASGAHWPYARSVAHLGVQVADALAYAAGQGVLHRDVKPSNLLLDLFGTVWLTDFGLAKATGTPDLTHTGDLFGTLRYMAPERFQGRADVRSDVYALGLTLYELLSLRPAFDDQGQAQLVRRIAMSEPARLDEVNRALPRDLVTIVHKAMAKDPADRYQKPGDLAEDLRRFLDDRPILARRLSVPEQAWRWCRRNPASAALVTTVLALTGLAIGGGLWVQQQQAEQRLEAARWEGRARQAAEAALGQAAGLQRQGLWTEAGGVLAQAESRLDDANLGDLRRRLVQARGDLDLVAKLESNRMGRVGLFGRKPDYGAVARGYAGAFEGAGLTVAEKGDEAVVAARIRTSGTRDPLVAALDDWALVTTDIALRARLLRVARLADPDPRWRDRVRDPALWGDRQALERLEEEARELNPTTLPPQLLTTLGVLLERAGGDPEPLLLAAQRRRPGDFWLNFELGMVLKSTKPAEALGFCRAALVVRPRSAVVYNLLGLALLDDKRLDEAGEAFRRALVFDPKLAAAHTNLGLILASEGRMEEAIAAHRKAVEFDPKGGLGYSNLGETLELEGRIEEAIAAYHKAIELDPGQARAYQRLRDALAAEGRAADSIAVHRRVLELKPKDSVDYHNLGNILKVEGRAEDAIAAYRRAIQLDPKTSVARLALGETLLREGRFTEARTEARRWLEQVLDGDPLLNQARQHLRDCELRLALDARLSAILEGREQAADFVEQRELAGFCMFYKRRYLAAARFYAAAFAAEPRLASDLRSGNRYNAACASALAAAGQGTDADRLEDGERAALRRQALDWLRADLAEWAKAVEKDPQGRNWGWPQQSLRHWRTDADLAAIRDAEPLAKLPTQERQACLALWEDVNALLNAMKRRHDPGSSETPRAGEQDGVRVR